MSDDADLTVVGDPGTRWAVREVREINAGSLKGAALVKTADFSLLRADFDGEEVVFELWLSLRLVEPNRITSWAAYHPASSDEPEEGSTYPDVAWRRVEWDRSRDYDRLQVAEDKAAYLLGDTQLDSRIRFGRLVELPQLAAAVREGVEVMKGGLVVHAADRPDMAWQSLHVTVMDGEMVMDLKYAPWATRCGEVERWAQGWSVLVDSLDDTGTVAPDGDITVSYANSFAELVVRTGLVPHADGDVVLPGKR